MMIPCYQLVRREVQTLYGWKHFLPCEGFVLLLNYENKIKYNISKILTYC
jgi:hypothetical protein